MVMLAEVENGGLVFQARVIGDGGFPRLQVPRSDFSIFPSINLGNPDID